MSPARQLGRRLFADRFEQQARGLRAISCFDGLFNRPASCFEVVTHIGQRGNHHEIVYGMAFAAHGYLTLRKRYRYICPGGTGSANSSTHSEMSFA